MKLCSFTLVLIACAQLACAIELPNEIAKTLAESHTREDGFLNTPGGEALTALRQYVNTHWQEIMQAETLQQLSYQQRCVLFVAADTMSPQDYVSFLEKGKELNAGGKVLQGDEYLFFISPPRLKGSFFELNAGNPRLRALEEYNQVFLKARGFNVMPLGEEDQGLRKKAALEEASAEEIKLNRLPETPKPARHANEASSDIAASSSAASASGSSEAMFFGRPRNWVLLVAILIVIVAFIRLTKKRRIQA